MSINHRQPMVHALFQWCMGGIYFFAFLSLYFQVRGLYGPDGLLPAHLQLKSDATLFEKFKTKFTLLWLAPYLNLNAASAMELLCIFGGLLSAGIIIFERFRNRLSFFILWLMYFSLYQVGQTFMWFQWDILLLETGFLTIFLSQNLQNSTNEYGFHHNLIFWLLKWLLFRLMFASGVVKLTSMCPAWWSLTALNWHYESQCIPTALAWYAHQLPEFFQKLSVVITFVIEIPIPFLFFSPLRSLRLLAFYSQIIFQVTIILTGNYNFFNALTIVLCLTLLDDQYINKVSPKFLRYPSGKLQLEKKSRISSIISSFLFFFILFSLIYFTKKLFNLNVKNGEIISEIMFTKDNFLKFVEISTKVGIGIGVVCFLFQVVKCIYRSVLTETKMKRLLSIMKSTLFIFVSTWLFCVSLVPFTEVDHDVQKNLWPVIQKWHSDSEYYHISNSYGLFRSMTGVGGRPELVIEGSDYYDKEWKELPFYYKPGNLSSPLRFVAPHQPRLDWQMWFAALGSYQRNPWFVHLIYKILLGSKDVRNLMAPSPFKNNSPKYVRSILYTYHYTKPRSSGFFSFIDSRKIKKWWRREYSKEYTPPLSKDDPSLVRYIQDMGWNSKNEIDPGMKDGTLFVILNFLYQHSRDISPTAFIFQFYIISVLTCFVKLFFKNPYSNNFYLLKLFV